MEARRWSAVALGGIGLGVVVVGLQVFAAASASESPPSPPRAEASDVVGREAPPGAALPDAGEPAPLGTVADADRSADGAQLVGRNETTDFYRHPDGMRTAHVFDGAVNWKDDATGQWQRIDPTLVGRPDGSFVNRSGPVGLRVAAETGAGDTVRISGDGWSVGYRLLGARDGRPVEVTGSRAVYAGVGDGVDLEYSFDGSSLKEVVVLRRPSAAKAAATLRFAVTLDGVTPRQGDDGTIEFVDESGTPVARVPKGVMWDSASHPTPTDIGEVALELGRTGTSWTIEVKPDHAWLGDPARAYPVRVDPTTTTVTSWGDAFVFQAYPTANFDDHTWVHGKSVFAGFNQSDHVNQYWALFHYDISPFIGMQIYAATWNAYFYQAQHYNNNLYRLRPAATSWMPGTVTWNTRPTPRSNEIVGRTTGSFQWASREVGSWIVNSTNGTWTMAGLIVDAPYDTNQVFQIAANEQGTSTRSYLSINYNRPPAVSGLQPAEGSILPTLSPQLSARYDENDGDVGFVQFEVYDNDTGALVTSGNGQTVASSGRSAWTVPAGALTSNRVYKWRARASDNFSVSAWSNYSWFTPDVSAPTLTQVVSTTHPVEGTWYPAATFSASWTPSADTSGIAGYWVSVDSNPTTEGTTITQTTTSLTTTKPDGVWYLHVRARDGVGNWGPTEHYEFRVDATRPPTVGGLSSSTHPAPETWYANDDPSFSWTAVADLSSGVAGYSWSLDHDPDTNPHDVPEGTATSASFADRPSGEWWFHVAARDNAGNWGVTAHRRVRIDKVAPTAPSGVTSSHLPAVISADRTADFEWNPATDLPSGVAGYSWTVNGSSTEQSDHTVDVTDTEATTSALGDGTWWFHVRAVDRAGNVSPDVAYGPIVIWGVAGAGLGIEPWWTFDGTVVGPQGSAMVNVANGNVVLQQGDSAPVQAHGDLAYVLRRTYNSQVPASAAELAGSIGAGWTLNVGETGDLAGLGLVGGRLEVDPAETFSNPAELVLVDRDGTRHRFETKGAAARVNVTPFLDPGVDGGSLETLVPRVVAGSSGTGIHLCVDQTYQAPEGVHLAVWRYAEVSSAHATDPCGNPASGTTPVVLGFGTMRPDRLRAEYAADGRLLSLTDANGVELRYRYLPAPDLRLDVVWEARSCTEAALDAPGSPCRAVRFEYPAVDRVEVTDPAGRVTVYHLDGHSPRRLVSVTNPDGSTVAYAYGTCGGGALALCSATDPRGHATTFTYAPGPDGARATTVVDRRGATTTYAYPDATVTTATEAGQRRRWSAIDIAGRIGRAEIGPVTGSPLIVTSFTWDEPGGACRQPDGRADHNLCALTRDSLDSTPDAETTWVYNAEGRRLRERQAHPDGNLDTTFGWRAQYVQADGTVVVYDDVVDPVAASGTVVSAGATSGRETPQTLFVLSDPTQSLSPRGNAAGGGYLAYLDTVKVDANPGVAPNQSPAQTCADPASPVANTGNVCETAGASSDGTNPTIVRYTYEAFGQRASMHSSKAIAEGNPARTTYTYFSDSERDLSASVSAGGWLRAVTDPTGAFVAFGYDAGGNAARTWDRNATAGHAVAAFPGSLASPPSPRFVETLRSADSGPAAYAEPWRYIRSTRDQLGNRTRATVDANGNATVARPPRGNAAGNDDFDVTRSFDPGDLLASELLPEQAADDKATTYTYDARGNPTARTDPNGHVRAFLYDEADRRIEERWTRGTWDAAAAPPSCRQSTAADAAVPAGRILCSTTTTFDGLGNVRSMTDANGRTATFAYDAVGRETMRLTPRHYGGHTTVRTDTAYDLDGNVVRTCPPRQFTEGDWVCDADAAFGTHTAYDVAGRPGTITRYRSMGAPVATTFAYDGDGNAISRTNPNGRTTTRTFDLQARKISETVPRGPSTSHTTTWQYAPSGDVTAVVRPGGLVTAYAYDAAHRPIRTVEGADSTVADAAGVTTADGGANVRTGVAYDHDGHVVAHFDPRAFSSSATVPDARFMARTEYDRNGRPVAQWLPRYDGASAVDLGLSATQASQCPTGAAPASVAGVPDFPADVGVCVTRAGYDAAGNRTELRLPTSDGGDGRYVAYRFTDDNLLAEVDAPNPSPAGGRVTAATYRYDGVGRPTRAVDALGHVDAATWTADGLLAQTVRQPGATATHVTTYGYDGAGNATSVQDAAGHTSTTAYTPDGLIVEVTDGGGNRIAYDYDAAGNPTTITSPSANARDATNPSGTPTVQTFTHDNLLATATEPVAGDGSLRRRTTYGYDPAGRKVSQAHASVNAGGATIAGAGAQTLAWSPAGRLLTETGRGGETISAVYDPAGNRVSVTDSTSGGHSVTGTWYLDGLPRTVDGGDVTARYAYDGSGAIVARADVDDATGGQTSTTYTYGDAGQPTTMASELTAPGGWTFTWDSAGRPVTRTGPNSTAVSWSHDADDTLTEMEVTGPGGALITRHSYSYDNLARVTTHTVDTQGPTGAPPIEGTRTFSYDPAGRLDSWVDHTGATHDVAFDADGNRTRYGEETFSYRADGSIAQAVPAPGAAPVAYTYHEPTGRLTSDGCRVYGYDGFDRTNSAEASLTSCPLGTPQGRATYAYDGLDRQRQATDPALGTTVVHRDGWSAGVTVERGGSSVGEAHYVLGIGGEPFMLRHTVGTALATHHLHDDGHGTVATVTDGAGAVACTALHDPYGTPQQPTPANPADRVCNTGATANTAWYRGARRDDHTGTYQFGSRTYDPAKAGWHTPDSYRAAEAPADLALRVDPLTRNSYAYVNGDPVNLADPSGHSVCSYVKDEKAQSRCFRFEHATPMMTITYPDGGKKRVSLLTAARMNADAGGSPNCTVGPQAQTTTWFEEYQACGVEYKEHPGGIRQNIANVAGGVLNTVTVGNADTVLSLGGIEDKVDYDSVGFRGGELAAVVVEVALGAKALVPLARAAVNIVRVPRALKAGRSLAGRLAGSAPRAIGPAGDAGATGLRISAQRQAGHVAGTPQYANRMKQGVPTSVWEPGAHVDGLTRHAWQHGTPVPGRPNVRDFDFGFRVGSGPSGGWQSRVRVHMDQQGRIHGHPAGPEY